MENKEKDRYAEGFRNGVDNKPLNTFDVIVGIYGLFGLSCLTIAVIFLLIFLLIAYFTSQGVV
jgi:hypothetical protein